MDRSFFNVLLLGVVFMLVFTAFQTMGNIQQTIIDSIKHQDKTFTGNGYISLAIIYITFSASNWLSPSVISSFGPRVAIIFGGITYLAFIVSFLWPITWIIYAVSALIGIGAAMIWTGQGNYLTLNSTSATISRNSGIFWAMLQMSMLIGNTFVFIKFRGLNNIDKATRTAVIATLSVICGIGVIIMFFLPRARSADRPTSITSNGNSNGPIAALKDALRLFTTRNMLLLNVTFFYTGIELGFYSGVYSSALGFTKSFPSPKELVGLSGILIGVGEVVGGAAFGILGSHTIKWGRDPIVLGGFLVHILVYFLIFLNIPNTAPLGDTNDSAFITCNAALAIFSSFLLGLGDACFNTQIFSILGDVYAETSAPAFALFKFTQSVGAAICFFYAPHMALYGHLGILVVLAVLGTITFIMVELSVKRLGARDEYSPKPQCD